MQKKNRNKKKGVRSNFMQPKKQLYQTFFFSDEDIEFKHTFVECKQKEASTQYETDDENDDEKKTTTCKIHKKLRK